MLVFITSLRHPWNCRSYDHVSYLLALSLQSVCAQTNRAFEVVVVCNRLPEGDYPDYIHWLQVNFPRPSALNTAVTGMRAIHHDRGAKYAVGLAYARRFKPTHLMFFDADDFISNRICEWVKKSPDVSRGWIISHGYQMRYRSNVLTPLNDFSKHCGTSIIHPEWGIKIPSSVGPDSSLEEITGEMHPYHLYNLLGAHRFAENHYERVHHKPLAPLPFPGAIWVLGTGENHSGKTMDESGVPVSPNIKDEFSIPEDWLRSTESEPTLA